MMCRSETLSLCDVPTHISMGGCADCICRTCLMWWSDRCPMGECYDRHRAVVIPYDAMHPAEPPRTSWSEWKNDQAYWCRGGVMYPAYDCAHYVKYKGSVVMDCLLANVQKFQDGYMKCGIGENADCERCYKSFMEKMEQEE